MTELVHALEVERAKQQESGIPGEPAIRLPIDKLLFTGGKNGEPLQAYVNMKDLAEALVD